MIEAISNACMHAEVGDVMKYCAVCLVTQLGLTLQPRDCGPPRSSVHEDSPGKDTGVGCQDLL